MKIPTKEQLLYAQLAIAHGIIDYIGTNLDRTIFDREIVDITDEIRRGFVILCFKMHAQFEKSESEADVSSQA